MQHNQRYLWFDLIRGLSAFAVCAGHLRAAVFQDYTHHGGSPLWQAFYFATGLGHQAVMVFFVLSGFFVGGSVLKKGPAFDWSDYAVTRLTRLWTVLLPALAVTAATDLVTHTVNPQAIAGGFAAIWHSGPGPGEFALDLKTWLANVCFLQTITSPVFGTNGPLWSLANEFWYYLMFPLGAIAIGWCGRVQGVRRLLPAALALGCLAWLPAGMSESYLIWLFGVAVWFVATRRWIGRGAPAIAWAGLALFLAALVASKRPGLSGPHVPIDFLIGAGFAVLAAGLASLPGRHAWPRPVAAMASGLSEFSYSLYLVHFPIVMLIGAGVYRDRPLAPGAVALAEYAGWLALLLAVGAGFWWLFERRTPDVRRYVWAAFARTAPARPVVRSSP